MKLRRDTLASAPNAAAATTDNDRTAAEKARNSIDLADALSSLQDGADASQPRTAADLIRENREGLDKILADQKAKAEKARESDKARAAQEVHKSDDTQNAADVKRANSVDLTFVLKAYAEFDVDKDGSKAPSAKKAA